MAGAHPTPTNLYDPMAVPLACVAAWAQAAGETMQAGVLAWSALARSWSQATTAYGALLGQALNVEAADALAGSNAADALLETELQAFENAAEHVAYAAEEVLVDLAGPLTPLPE